MQNYGGLDTPFDDIPGTPFMRTPRSSLDSSFKSPTALEKPSGEDTKPAGAELLLKPALTASQETLVVSSSEESGIDSDAGGQRKLIIDVKKEASDDDKADIQNQSEILAQPESSEVKVENVSVKPDPDSVPVKTEASDEPPVSMDGVKTEEADSDANIPPQLPGTETIVKEELPPVSQDEQMHSTEIPGLGSGIPGLSPGIPGFTLASESVQEEKSENVEVKTEIANVKQDERTKSDAEQAISEANKIEKMEIKVESQSETSDAPPHSSSDAMSKPTPTQSERSNAPPQLSTDALSKPTAVVVSKPAPKVVSKPASKRMWRAASEWGTSRTVTVRSIPVDVRLSRENSPRASPTPADAKSEQQVPSGTVMSEQVASSGEGNVESATPSSNQQAATMASGDAKQESTSNDGNLPSNAGNVALTGATSSENKDIEGGDSVPMQTDSSQQTQQQDVTPQPEQLATGVEHSSTESTQGEGQHTATEPIVNPSLSQESEAKTEAAPEDDEQPPGTPLMDEPKGEGDNENVTPQPENENVTPQPENEEEKEEEKIETPPGTPLMDEPPEKLEDALQGIQGGNADPSAIPTTESSQETSTKEGKTSEEVHTEESTPGTSQPPVSEERVQESEQHEENAEQLDRPQQVEPSSALMQDRPPEGEEQLSITVVGRPRVNQYGYSSPRRGSPRRDEYMPQSGFDQSRRNQSGFDQSHRGQSGFDQSRRGHYRGRGGHAGFDPHHPHQNPTDYGRGWGRGRRRGRGRARGRGRGNQDYGSQQLSGGSMNFAEDQF